MFDIASYMADCKREALMIDPETAEVIWRYAQTCDPYGVIHDLPEECDQIGRVYFVRRPDGDIWVWFGDLSERVRQSLWDKIDARRAFAAGFEEDAVCRPAPEQDDNDAWVET